MYVFIFKLKFKKENSALPHKCKNPNSFELGFLHLDV